ncbi:agmatine deiminase family protein [Parachitinimonas caeni]|uniref:Putative agmatine deiminase n=1 Tax=Parachitinimonas caeni TaxID=3031301 RepID=A0ABT7DZY0_9NEIS|nr:agmatine deiminase family protein [Parachitinimonas caeni]MDK2125613.1 agmatine deiminase family protein [Parachitinimonas caeni]
MLSPITPASLGFSMPAEWTAHERCWLAFPCREELWGGEAELTRARVAYAKVAQAINEFEAVCMVARPEDATLARSLCGSNIEVMELPIDDSWMRDQGPTFVTNAKGEVAGVDWIFNCWGGLFPDFENDAAVAGRMLDAIGASRFEAPLVLEGGAFHVDGRGSLLTTAQCLLHPNRNPRLSREQIEQMLCSYLGVRNIIWLGNGLFDDHTDGHVDDIACFVNETTILAQRCDDPFRPNYAAWQDNQRRLAAARDVEGKPYQVVTLPEPAPRHLADAKNHYVSLSYVNFYPANGGIVMPVFGDPSDDEAVGVIRELFPQRKVITLPVAEIFGGGGGIHCITQQQPAGPLAKL